MPRGSAFKKPVKVSGPLAEFLGTKKIKRGQIMADIWKYIKRKKLQDKKDKRIINPDTKLIPLFGKEPVHMMKIAKKISPYIG